MGLSFRSHSLQEPNRLLVPTYSLWHSVKQQSGLEMRTKFNGIKNPLRRRVKRVGLVFTPA